MLVKKNRLVVGWCEWCKLPQLGLPGIKAKIDTGAKTSALHAFNIRPFYKKGKDFVRFLVYPLQFNDIVSVECVAEVVDERNVISSNGHNEHRYVISTPLWLGGEAWNIELTLSNRDPLKFRMLLGRSALKHTVIYPNRSLCQGKMSKKKLCELYG